MAENRPEKYTRADKTAQRRQLIVEAAATLFILKGFHQTGMRDIAGEAGISLGNLYNHFKGKHEIIAAIAEIEASEMEPLLNLLESAPVQGSAALIEFAQAYYAICSSPENAALSAEIVAEIFRNPEAGGTFLSTRSRLIGALERHIPDIYSSRKATAGLVLDLIERAGQSAVGTSAASQKEIRTSLLEILTRVIEPS
ncbi:helix-turn-helix domain-containing protein [uncultured Roseibium sp.]|uniref:TetR/AcrR family transcriptional regulator n=1 Tax=uncultured Roseibium sp. TaxID=1936171 RepID=UPI00261EE1E5|nr:helix-turn-helix domain-containing protein [uncultured Roseibium sp.]